MNPAHRRPFATFGPLFALAAACGLLSGGCHSQEQYNQALQRSADLQSQLDQARTALQVTTDELKAERDKTMELTAARDKAARAVQAAEGEAQQLRKTLEAARRELDSANTLVAREHAELQRAVESQREARSRMEQELADRQREIDVLQSKVRQLERQIEQAGKASPRNTQPSSAPS